MDSSEHVLKAAGRLLTGSTPELPEEELVSFVESFIQRRSLFLQLIKKYGSPLYVIEPEILRTRVRQFRAAFRNELSKFDMYYAVKSNNCPEIVNILISTGIGLDVSSGAELRLALQCRADDIVFSGPGKTDDELRLAVDNRDRVTLLIDSFGELERLGKITREIQGFVRAGVRLTTDDQGLWRKFGIPLSELERFMVRAGSFRQICFAGLQFHTSWNMDPENQIAFIKRLGKKLQNLSDEQREQIDFIDIGGGFWPSVGEWLQPAGTPEGRLRQVVEPAYQFEKHHYKVSALPICDFASRIGLAVKTYIYPFVTCRICAEPGRWICNDAMHLLLSVADKKPDDLVITDAGTNAIGWERFEVDYAPIINLSCPETLERESLILGSLCTPHDVWGYGYWGSEIKPGDVLLIPSQGAYTYSLSQSFIKELPTVVFLSGSTVNEDRVKVQMDKFKLQLNFQNRRSPYFPV